MVKRWFAVSTAVLLASLLVVGCGVPQEDYDAVVADKEAAEAKVKSLTSQLAAPNNEASKAKSDLTEVKSELATATSDLEAVQSEIESVKSATSSAQSAASKAKSDMAAEEATLAEKEATIAEKETKIAELEAAIAAAEEEERVETEGGFSISLIEVCSDVKGSGDYTPLPDATVHITQWLLQEDQERGLDIWLYFEVTGFEQKKTGSKYEIWLQWQELKIYNGNGDTLIEDLSDLDESHVMLNKKRDSAAFWISLSLGKVSEGGLYVRVGDYRFTVEVVDKLSGEIATKSIDFRVEP